MKTVTILHGSARKSGNSAVLAGQVAQGVKGEGGDVRLFNLHELSISPCTGCENCQTDPGSGCVIDDGMREIYESVLESGAVVFAGPVYWFGVSAQTKTALDRLYAIGGGDANVLGGKALGIVLTYADADPFVSGAANAVRMFQDVAGYLGVVIKGVVHGSAYGPGEIKANRPVMRQARDLGRELAG
jgi:multimeric flavodoxin WrbA